MRAKYRINWKSGMKLSDAVFNASDDFHMSRLQPLYEFMLNGGYGHLSQPRFRCEADDSEMSVIEMNVTALTPDGSLIDCRFDHNERDLFRKLPMPASHESFTVYLEQSPTGFDSFEDKEIPYRAEKLNLVFKPEDVHYANPYAVAVARFEYKHCWAMDTTFIPPCLSLKANADLWNLGHSYSRVLSEMVSALRAKTASAAAMEVTALLPAAVMISTEVRKEMDGLSPKHLVTLMQQLVGATVAVFENRFPETVPEREACAAFTEAEFVSNRIGPMVDEGVRLTRLLLSMVSDLRQPEPEPVPVSVTAPQVSPRLVRQPRVSDTSSERKSFKSRK